MEQLAQMGPICCVKLARCCEASRGVAFIHIQTHTRHIVSIHPNGQHNRMASGGRGPLRDRARPNKATKKGHSEYVHALWASATVADVIDAPRL